MTLGDVKRQILNLGFETKDSYSDDPSIVTDAINTAMREITNTFPLVGEYKISQNPLKNLLSPSCQHIDMRHYDGLAPVVYSANDSKSLYFECSGAGSLNVKDDSGERVVALSSERAFKEHREFVRGRVTITFTGNFSYDIKNVAIYGELYSDKLEDIPSYRQYIRYDFRELTKVDGIPTFIEFMDKVQEGDTGNTYIDIRDFHIEKRYVLILNGLEKAQYTIFYKKNFALIQTDTPDTTEIELDYDKQHLLSLLAAYYVWADDDRTKATMWRNEYDEYSAKLSAQLNPKTSIEPFKNEMGW